MNSSSSSSTRPRRQISDVLAFVEVAHVLEKTCKLKTSKQKNKIIEEFIAHCRNNFSRIHHTLNSDAADGDSIFPVIRILLLSLDRERAAYGMKANTLAKLLAESLGVNEKDKLKLTKFRDPGKSGNEAENFATLVYDIMQSRFSDASPSSLSLTALHDVLDRLARTAGSGVNTNVQKQIFLELFTKWKITPLEGKWISRILLKNLEFGVTSHMIFKFIHPQAKEFYDSTSNLKKLCQTLNDPTAVVDAGNISMFYYVKPMLCKRTDTLDDFDPESVDNPKPGPSTSKIVEKRYKKSSDSVMSPPFVVETKWDGERFQLHYDGSVFKYMSKKGFDFSDNYNLTLTPRLKPQIQPGVKSFIIDGEMMAWNKKYKVFTQKGDQIDVKRFTVDNENHCPAFVVIDVLLYNDEIMIKKPLEERSKILRSIMKPKEGAVIVPQQKLLNNKQQVEEALNAAIDNLEEGLVIKSLDSRYEPGKRGLYWRKIKPEFIYGTSVTDLDLLILGAYFTESTRKAGTIAHFLVGIMEKTGYKEEFYPVTSVGSGKLRNNEMQELIAKLSPRFERKEYTSVKYKGKKRPDLFINPKKSIVVSVKASEITVSDEYVINLTLRFPRISQIREDKRYDQIMTVNEFKTLRDSCGGRLAKRTDSNKGSGFGGRGFGGFRKRTAPEKQASDTESSGDDKPSPKKNGRNEKSLAIAQRSYEDDIVNDSETAPVPDTKKKSKPLVITTKLALPKQEVILNIFKSQVFCVYGSAVWKTKMQDDIRAYGGVIVQNPVKDKFWMVGESESNIKVQNAIKTFKYDVLKPIWVTRCIEYEEQVSFSPKDFYQYTEETAELFKGKYDKFGDSYTELLSLNDVKDLVKKVIFRSDFLKEEIDSDSDVDVAEEMEAELFPREDKRNIDQYNFFKGIKVAFRGSADPVLKAMIEFYSGKVLDDSKDETVTHIIVTPQTQSVQMNADETQNLTAMLVKPNWIRDCVKERRCLDEWAYSA